MFVVRKQHKSNIHIHIQRTFHDDLCIVLKKNFSSLRQKRISSIDLIDILVISFLFKILFKKNTLAYLFNFCDDLSKPLSAWIKLLEQICSSRMDKVLKCYAKDRKGKVYDLTEKFIVPVHHECNLWKEGNLPDVLNVKSRRSKYYVHEDVVWFLCHIYFILVLWIYIFKR